MPYSTNMITAVADCDLLLAMATKEKANLDFKKLSEQRQKSTYSENAVEIEAELQLVNAEISASETIINTIPDGETKDDAVKKLKKQQYRKFLLEERKESNGVVALLEKEMDLERLSQELTAIDDFIAELNNRKSTL